MALLWLRFALGCYFVGLIYAFFALSRTSDLFSRIALQAASLGMVFHIVFFLTFVAAVGQQPFVFTSSVSKGWLIPVHIALIFTGYAALLFSFVASLLYLLQERRLKAKKASSLISFLPALEVIDQIGYRSLMLGFPFMTLGLLTG